MSGSINIEKTKKYWSTGFGSGLYRKYAKRYFRKMHAYIATKIAEERPSELLDIACGPGDFLSYLHTQLPDVHLAGTDIAKGMVQYASEKLQNIANIVECSAGIQPFSDNRFDVITVMMAFHHFPEKKETLEEFKRILKQNGTLYIFDVVARSQFQKRMWNFIEKIIGVLGFIGHYTVDDLYSVGEEVGFSNITCTYLPNASKRYRLFKLKR